MGGEAPQGLIDGELALSTAFNGRIYAARKQGAPIGLTWHHALVQYDYWVVPKNSPNYDNAMKFLAFVSRAKPQADFSNEMAFGPVNSKAYAFIRPDLAPWLPASPQNQKRSEEHTSELQSLMRISYAVFCLKKKTTPTHIRNQ